MKNILIVGLGEIGKAMQKIELEACNNVKIAEINIIPPKLNYDVMHICIPYSKSFATTITKYIMIYKPKLTIINSTIDIGTTDKIFQACNMGRKQYNIVHSFCRGVHPNLYEGIKEFVKYIGGDKDSAEYAIEHLESIKIEPYYLGSSQTTELAKLCSTSYYGWCIRYAKEVQKLCDIYGLDYNKVYTHTNQTYNDGYKRLGMEHVIRPILTPPEDGISGHCIIENAILLNKPKNLLSEIIIDTGKQSNKTYQDNAWLYCEHINKKRTPSDIASECGVTVDDVKERIKKLNGE